MFCSNKLHSFYSESTASFLTLYVSGSEKSRVLTHLIPFHTTCKRNSHQHLTSSFFSLTGCSCRRLLIFSWSWTRRSSVSPDGFKWVGIFCCWRSILSSHLRTYTQKHNTSHCWELTLLCKVLCNPAIPQSYHPLLKTDITTECSL